MFYSRHDGNWKRKGDIPMQEYGLESSQQCLVQKNAIGLIKGRVLYCYLTTYLMANSNRVRLRYA